MTHNIPVEQEIELRAASPYRMLEEEAVRPERVTQRLMPDVEKTMISQDHQKSVIGRK
jgi:hypothetical protein